MKKKNKTFEEMQTWNNVVVNKSLDNRDKQAMKLWNNVALEPNSVVKLPQDFGKMKAEVRKATPVFSGVLAYFPDALKEVSKASLAGNKQHLEGTPLHWDRSKSTDQLDALTRHLIDHASGEIIDDDGVYHLAKVCWRGLAQLQLLVEQQKLK